MLRCVFRGMESRSFHVLALQNNTPPGLVPKIFLPPRIRETAQRERGEIDIPGSKEPRWRPPPEHLPAASLATAPQRNSGPLLRTSSTQSGISGAAPSGTDARIYYFRLVEPSGVTIPPIRKRVALFAWTGTRLSHSCPDLQFPRPYPVPVSDLARSPCRCLSYMTVATPARREPDEPLVPPHPPKTCVPAK